MAGSDYQNLWELLTRPAQYVRRHLLGASRSLQEDGQGVRSASCLSTTHVLLSLAWFGISKRRPSVCHNCADHEETR